MLAFILQFPEEIESLLTAAIEAKASPLKPRVVMLFKSAVSTILLVACGRAQADKSSFVMPEPLSEILIFSIPPPEISTEIESAPRFLQGAERDL